MIEETLHARLRALGIDYIEIDYSGTGDSGSINNVSAYLLSNRDNGKPSPQHLNDLERNFAISEEVQKVIRITNDLLGEKRNALEQTVEDMAYDLLAGLDDWCNNDGGQGSMVVHVESGPSRHDQDCDETREAGDIYVYHETNYTQVNTTEHLF